MRAEPAAIDRAARREITSGLAAALRGEALADRVAAWRARPGCCAALPALAEGHGVAALLAERLAGELPGPAAAALGDAAARTLARGERLAADWDRLRLALAAAEVPALPLKWAGLAAALYAPPGLRPAADLDILVPASRRDEAAAVLLALGYAPVARTWKHEVYLRPENRRLVDGRGEHPENPRPVELHCRLGEAFRGLGWDLTPELDFGLPALPPGIALAHLAAHATVDALGRRLRLVQLEDLARLGRRLEADDWRLLLALASRPGAARFVWPGLWLAGRWLGAEPPPAVLDGLACRVRPALRAWAAAADPDGLSWFGRPDTPRRLLEVPSIWPETEAERWRVWRFILWPGRQALADRHPRLAGSAAWPALVPLHLAFSLRRLAARWRRRAA